MCYFITVALPAARAELLRQAIPRELQLSPSRNPSVAGWLDAEERAFLVMSHGCSCDLYRANEEGSAGSTEATLRRKYGRKGWSEAKIQRALAQAQQARERRPAFVGLRPDLLAHLCRLAAEAERVSLLVHWYDGDPEVEAVPVRGRTVVPCDGSMSPVEPDWLVELRSAALPNQGSNADTESDVSF